MAQEAPLIGGVVGAIIGTFFGAPTVGWMIGSAIGALFVPKPITHAITDLTVQTSAYGQGVSQVFGTQRLAGNIIWAGERQWISTSGKGGKGGSGGSKGGGGQGMGYYTVNIAIAICEGPIAGIKRIWAGGDLIFDDGQPVLVPSRPSGGKKGGTTAPSYQTFSTSGNPITSSGGSAVGSWTLYHGTLEQPPDPTVNGTGYGFSIPSWGDVISAPAPILSDGIGYEGIAYIVFEQMYLGPAGAIPPLTFEVAETGSLVPPQVVGSFPGQSVTINGQAINIYQFGCFDSSGNLIVPCDGGEGHAQWVKFSGTDLGTVIATGPEVTVSGYANGLQGFSQNGGQTFAWLLAEGPNSNGVLTGFYSLAYFDPDAGWPIQTIAGTVNSGRQQNPFGLVSDGLYLYSPSMSQAVETAPGVYAQGLAIWDESAIVSDVTGQDIPLPPNPANYAGAPFPGNNQYQITAVSGVYAALGGLGHVYGLWLYCVATSNAQTLTTLGSIDISQTATPTAVTTDGTDIWVQVTDTSGQNWLVQLSINANQTATGPIVSVANAYKISQSLQILFYAAGALWGCPVNGALAKYTMQGTLWHTLASVGSVRQMLFDGSYLWAWNGTWYKIDPGDHEVAASDTTLPQAITTLCQRAGIASFDVSQLPSTPVNFLRSDTTDARSILKSLSLAYLFDMVDSGGTLRFVPHGLPPVATIPLADLGFGPVTPNAEPPYAATRQQGIDLPRSVRVRYQSAALNYNPYEQMFSLESYDDGRQVVIHLPLTLDDQTAYNIAALACCIPHIERMQYAFTTSLKWLALEPGDVVILPFGVCRILTVRMKRSNEAYLEFTACIDGLNALAGSGFAVPGMPDYLPNHLANYAPPTATTGTTSGVSAPAPHPLQVAPPMLQAVPNPGIAKGAFVEPPPLDSLDTTPRFYVGAYTTGNTFPGAAIYVSVDGGSTYSLLTTETAAAGTGRAINALPPGNTDTWDTVNTLSLYVSPAGLQLSPLPDSQVFAGNNMLMLGSELIQFGDATLLTDSFGNPYYQLSRLLRGRRGTQWAVGTHSAGEQAVFILANLSEESYTMAMLRNPRLYKVVMMGQSYANVVAKAYEPSGASLTPWAVAHPQAQRGTNGDLIISWTPTSRTNGDFASGYTPTLDNDAAGWSLDILKGTTVVRTVNLPVGTTPSAWTWTYTGLMQNADGFRVGDPMTINIYQLSSAIGRGIVRSLAA